MKFLERIRTIWIKSSRNTRQKIVIILLSLVIINAAVWIAGIFFSRMHPLFLGLIAIAYGLGLRHAVDADHIAAIDNTTRKLMNQGIKPVAIGLFFSLGHSTIVIILSILVAFSSVFIKQVLPTLQTTGTIIGTTVSSFFLLLIGLINLVAFFDILRIFKTVKKSKKYNEEVITTQLQSGGIFTRIFRPFLKTVKSSWQMYFIGFLFGLGFDTASEVGLLSISAASSVSGISYIEILLLPLAFTAGMVLIDTVDGILMLGAYGWAYIQPMSKLYYNLNITIVSVIIALFIGGVEALQLISAAFNMHNDFFQMINAINFSKLGYISILIFITSWLISFSIYKIKRFDEM